MAGLATIIRREKRRNGGMRVLVLGLDWAGKSSLVCRWRMVPTISGISPTQGFRIWTVRERVSVWDVGGQMGIRQYWRNYFESTDGIVFVIDAAAPYRVAEAVDELRKLLFITESERNADASCNNNDQNGAGDAHKNIAENTGRFRLMSTSVLILANKCDIGQGMNELCEIINPILSVLEREANIHCKLFVTSALENTNVDESLSWLIADISKRMGISL